jgi:recombination protein RecT
MNNGGQVGNNQQLAQAPKTDIRSVMQIPAVEKRFNQILKDRAPAFMTSIINVSESTPALKRIAQTNGISIIRAASVAASMNLPIDKNLGFSWIVPYGKEAQFQIGAKGFIQLAMRTGQYKKINVTEVYENQFKSWNALTEDLQCDMSVDGTGEIVGFAAYFRTINGFEKMTYWTKEALLQHGKRYSKSFKNGPWTSHPDEMCKKTALKLTISRWGILSTEMELAQKADQAVVKGDNLEVDANFEFPDNPVDDTENGGSTKPEVRKGKRKPEPKQEEVVEQEQPKEVEAEVVEEKKAEPEMNATHFAQAVKAAAEILEVPDLVGYINDRFGMKIKKLDDVPSNMYVPITNDFDFFMSDGDSGKAFK